MKGANNCLPPETIVYSFLQKLLAPLCFFFILWHSYSTQNSERLFSNGEISLSGFFSSYFFPILKFNNENTPVFYGKIEVKTLTCIDVYVLGHYSSLKHAYLQNYFMTDILSCRILYEKRTKRVWR